MCLFLHQNGQPNTEILLLTEPASQLWPLAPQGYQTSATEEKTSGFQNSNSQRYDEILQ